MTSTLPVRHSDAVAARVRELRQKEGITAAALADRCARIGVPEMTASVIANIETGRRDETGRRRRDVTVDELVVFARALGVSPATLLAADGMEIWDDGPALSGFIVSLMTALEQPDVQAAIGRAVTEYLDRHDPKGEQQR